MSVARLKKPIHRRLTLGGYDVVVTLSVQGIVICRRYRGRRSACLNLENMFQRFLRDPRAALEQTELPILRRQAPALELVERGKGSA